MFDKEIHDLTEKVLELENECEEWAKESRETIEEWNKLKVQIDILENENKQLKENADEEEVLRNRLSFLLTQTANALHGGPKENGFWSWHDLPELAAAAMEKIDELENELKKWKRVL